MTPDPRDWENFSDLVGAVAKEKDRRGELDRAWFAAAQKTSTVKRFLPLVALPFAPVAIAVVAGAGALMLDSQEKRERERLARARDAFDELVALRDSGEEGANEELLQLFRDLVAGRDIAM